MAQEYRPKMQQPNTDMTSVGLPDVVNAARIGTQAANEIAQGERAARTDRLNENAMLATLPTQMVAAEEALRAQVIDNKRSLALMPIEIEQAEAELDALNMENKKANLAFEMGLVKEQIAGRKNEIANNNALIREQEINRAVTGQLQIGGRDLIAKMKSNVDNPDFLFNNDINELKENLYKSTDPQHLALAEEINKTQNTYVTNRASILRADAESVYNLPENANEDQIEAANIRKREYYNAQLQSETNPVVSNLIKTEINTLNNKIALTEQIRQSEIFTTAQSLFPGNPDQQATYVKQQNMLDEMTRGNQLTAQQAELTKARATLAFNTGQNVVEQFFADPEILENSKNWDNKTVAERNVLRNNLKQQFMNQFVPEGATTAEKNAFEAAFNIYAAEEQNRNAESRLAQLDETDVIVTQQAGEVERDTSKPEAREVFGSIHFEDISNASSGWWSSLFQGQYKPELAKENVFFNPTPYKNDFRAELDYRIDGLRKQYAQLDTITDLKVRENTKKDIADKMQILQETKAELNLAGLDNLIPFDIKPQVLELLNLFKEAGRARHGWRYDQADAKDGFYSLTDALDGYYRVGNIQQTNIDIERLALRNQIEENNEIIKATKMQNAVNMNSPFEGDTGLPSANIGRLEE